MASIVQAAGLASKRYALPVAGQPKLWFDSLSAVADNPPVELVRHFGYNARPVYPATAE